jgi:putative DNA primase/helicase
MWPLDALPDEIQQSDRCVVWRREYANGNGRITKIPYVATEPARLASSTDPNTWRRFLDARCAYEDGKCDGAGFVLGDGYVGIDIDHCVVDGEIDADARAIVDEIGSYTELSPSGTGLHILARGSLPAGRRRTGRYELYDSGRYFTLTGHHIPGTPTALVEATDALQALHRRLFGDVAHADVVEKPLASGFSEAATLLDDHALLDRAFAASNGAAIQALWNGDASAYASRSEADLALCAHLAFYTDRDAHRIDTLFRQSGLMREKWDERRGAETYGERTIGTAIAGCTQTYTPPTTAEPHIVIEPGATTTVQTLDPAALDDVSVVAAEGQHIAATGVPYLVDGIVPAYGMLGMLVAFTKVGKTTLGQALGAAVATGQPFLEKPTRQTRVLIVAAEDPPEYTAWLARHLGTLPPGVLTFYRRPLLLNTAGLTQIAGTVQADGYGLVLIASWQAVVRGLIKDENDNAGAVRIVEHVKTATRATGIPWLIDAHSGKGEDQGDDADPTRALRGASGAAGAADYMLSLRYANGPFGSRRRLSGKGRFASFAPLVLDYDAATGAYAVIGTTKDAAVETTWRLITETGALSTVPQTADAIARAAGLVNASGCSTSTGRRQVRQALSRRDGIRTTTETRRGQLTTLYARQEAP